MIVFVTFHTPAFFSLLVRMQVRMLYGGKTHTAHKARVRHARDARLEAGRV